MSFWVFGGGCCLIVRIQMPITFRGFEGVVLDCFIGGPKTELRRLKKN